MPVPSQILNPRKFGYVFLDNDAGDCVVVRDGCEANLDHINEEDIPKLGKNAAWNRFEVSDEYYEMCAAVSASNSTFSMTPGELKAIEGGEESGALEGLISSI